MPDIENCNTFAAGDRSALFVTSVFETGAHCDNEGCDFQRRCGSTTIPAVITLVLVGSIAAVGFLGGVTYCHYLLSEGNGTTPHAHMDIEVEGRESASHLSAPPRHTLQIIDDSSSELAADSIGESLAALAAQEGSAHPSLRRPPEPQPDSRFAVPVHWSVTAERDLPPDEVGFFRMVQHSDGNVSLKSALDLWIGVYPTGDDRSSVKAVGVVLADGVISADAYSEDAQKFALMVSSDGSFSLKHSLGGCVAASGIGELRLGDCNSADASFTTVFQDDERVVAEASSRNDSAKDVLASEVGSQLEVEFHRGIGVPLRKMTSFSNLNRASIVVEGVENVSRKVSRKMAIKSKSGLFFVVQRGWLQDFQVLMMAINDTEAAQSAVCTRFEIITSVEGKIALRTMRSSYVVSGFAGHYTTGSEMEMFTKVDNDDGTISLQTSKGMFWSALPRGLVYSSVSASLWERFRIVTQPDGTVSIRNSNDFPICAVERTVSVLTCETRSTANRSYFMQGSSPSVRVSNLGSGTPWYGYRTKVDLYYKYVKERAELDYAGELIILTDNGDMAWGGCSYQELLAKYDEITRASDMAPVVAGADNALYPFGTWDYSKFDSRRERVMKAFNISVSAYCAFSNCHEYEYKYANSGFLMGPPRELSWLLACMIGNGKVEAGTHRGALLDSDSGFDDQQGLHECMSAHPELVTLDYAGTLSLELIKFDKLALVSNDGKVFNKAADSSQCFVHGNGDTLGTVWDSLFPTSTLRENWGEDFYH